MDNKQLLLIGGAGVALLLLTKNSGSGGLSSLLPGSTALAANANPQAITNDMPAGAMYGINSGVKGGNGSFYTVSNWSALAAANPNLLNPNYQLTTAEAEQYVSNYLDLQQGLAQWPGGLTQANAQKHWNLYGAIEKRIFLPMVPPSTGNFVQPVANGKAASGGGGGFVKGATSVLGSIAHESANFFGTIVSKILGPNDGNSLNEAEIQMIFLGSNIVNQILPLYANEDRQTVNEIQTSLNNVLSRYV